MTPKKGDRLYGLEIELVNDGWGGHDWRCVPLFWRYQQGYFSKGQCSIKGPGFNYQRKDLAIQACLRWLVTMEVPLDGSPHRDTYEFIPVDAIPRLLAND